MSVTEVNDRSTALVATSTSKATPDLLARAFLDILARASGDDSKSMLRSGDPDDPIEKLLDDLSSVSSRDDHASIRPDVAAIAILTARALDTVPDLIKELRRASPVVTIATHNPEYWRSWRKSWKRAPSDQTSGSSRTDSMSRAITAEARWLSLGMVPEADTPRIVATRP